MVAGEIGRLGEHVAQLDNRLEVGNAIILPRAMEVKCVLGKEQNRDHALLSSMGTGAIGEHGKHVLLLDNRGASGFVTTQLRLAMGGNHAQEMQHSIRRARPRCMETGEDGEHGVPVIL